MQIAMDRDFWENLGVNNSAAANATLALGKELAQRQIFKLITGDNVLQLTAPAPYL